MRTRAKWIDKFIDLYTISHHRNNLPRKQTSQLIDFLFPGSSYLGRGAFKNAYYVKSSKRDLVLKLSRARDIRKDMAVYRRIPRTVRNRYFAKIYWCTHYTMLQKYGSDARIPTVRLEKLRKIANRYGLRDVGPRNIKMVDGVFKIVDALPRRPQLT